MIIFYKTPPVTSKRLISSKAIKVIRRKKKVLKLTKSNKDFLKALGFKT